jgi:catalase (peroxidase I)
MTIYIFLYSDADLWTLAGVVAIKELSGPTVPWKPGRKDKTDDKDVPPNGRLPDAEKGEDHIREVFNRMGFNDRLVFTLLIMLHIAKSINPIYINVEILVRSLLSWELIASVDVTVIAQDM